MAKQAAGFNPISYAVCYEYAAGINLPLKSEIDKITDSGQLLDDHRIWSLYEKYIAKRDDDASANLRAELERMLHDLSLTTTTTGEHVTAYSKSLDGFGDQLKPGIDPEQLKVAVAAMIENTEQMRIRAKALEAQLQESSHEVEVLRTKLARATGDALTDPLTGIANRRGFTAAIDAADARKDGLGKSCLIAIDIDHFKKCNDTYGHLFGDKVIRSLAQILTRMIKGQDTAARIGGEEFVILLPDTAIEGACKLAEHIRAVVEAGSISNGTTGDVGKITISLGITDYLAGETIEAYMARADKALYASKAGGRNRVTITANNTPRSAAVKPDTEIPAPKADASAAYALRHPSAVTTAMAASP
ncbi:MAG: GGDEF domain-containing protein [Burkholderiales bacterium]